jgi:hypothetical protein
MQKRSRVAHGDTPPVPRTPLASSPLNISARGLAPTGTHKARSQLSGLACLMTCSMLALVVLSVLQRYHTRSDLTMTDLSSDDRQDTNPRYSTKGRYEVQPRHMFRQANSVLELRSPPAISDEWNSSSLRTRLQAPCPHVSRVFPRASDEPIDSVVVVSFDVFENSTVSGGHVDPAVRELETIIRGIVSSDAFNDTEKRQAVRSAALWSVGRAVLSRPSGFEQRPEGSAASTTYFSFFSGRNASGWTFNATSSAVLDPPPTPADERPDSMCTLPVVQERYRTGAPVTMDVVYTHVADDSRSHRAFRKRFPQAFRGSPQRFRDWNELKFSTRSVFHRSICDDPKSVCYHEDSSGAHPTALVGNIYIVVADSDQVPPYINTSHTRIHIVEHTTLFGMSGEEGSLPTFNSHAIESTLHRIPGLSRFYVYFNNDMMWGRQLSFFDYFRPLAEPRFDMRCSLIEAQLASQRTHCEPSAGDDQELRDLVGSSGSVDLAQLRVTMMFEPIVHHENTESTRDLKFERKRYVDVSDSRRVATSPPYRVALPRGDQVLAPAGNVTPNATIETFPTERATMSVNATTYLVANCSAQGIDMQEAQFHDFQPLFLLATGRRASVISERFRTFIANNKNYAMEVLGVAGWPSHFYSHSPHLYDRDVMSDMLEKDFHHAAKATRKSQLRHGSNLWTTMLACSYHTMHRKVLDWELLDGRRVAALRADAALRKPSQTMQPWSRGASLEGHPLRNMSGYVAFPRVLEHVHHDSSNGSVSLDSLLAPYWSDARANAELGVEAHRYTHTMLRALEYLLMVAAAAAGSSTVTPLQYFHADTVEPQLSGLLGARSSRIFQQKMCALLLGDNAGGTSHVIHLLIAPHSTSLEPNTEDMRRYAIVEDCHRARQKKPTPLWTVTEIEKLDHHVVKLDQKAGMYHFCMMNTLRAVQRYTNELSHEVKLFVAANDDFAVRLPIGVDDSVRRLLSTATGNVPSASWEVWWKHHDEV